MIYREYSMDTNSYVTEQILFIYKKYICVDFQHLITANMVVCISMEVWILAPCLVHLGAMK